MRGSGHQSFAESGGWREVEREVGCLSHLGARTGQAAPLSPSERRSAGRGSFLAAADGPGQAAGAAWHHAESTIRRYSTFSLGLEANAGSSV